MKSWLYSRRIKNKIRCLASFSSEAVIEAAKELGDLGDQEAIGPLINTLSNKSEPVRLAAAEALRKFGSACVAQLCAIIKSIDNSAYRYIDIHIVLDLLSTIGAQQSLVKSTVISFMTDLCNGFYWRQHAAKIIDANNWPLSSDSERAIKALLCEDWKGAAATGDAWISAILAETESNIFDSINHRGWDIFAKMAEPSAILVNASFSDKNPYWFQNVLRESLNRLNPSKRTEVLQALRNIRAEQIYGIRDHKALVEMFAKIDSSEGVIAARELLTNKKYYSEKGEDGSELYDVWSLLGRIDSPECADIISNSLQLAMTHGLGKNDGNRWSLQLEAANALGLHIDRRAIDLFFSVIREAKTTGLGYVHRAIWGLGQYGDQREFSYLLDLAKDKWEVGAFAFQNLFNRHFKDISNEELRECCKLCDFEYEEVIRAEDPSTDRIHKFSFANELKLAETELACRERKNN